MKRIFYIMGLLLATLVFSNVYAENNNISLYLTCPNSVTPKATVTCKVYANISGSDVEYIEYVTITGQGAIDAERYNINQTEIGVGKDIEIGTVVGKAGGSTGSGQLTISADVKFKDGEPSWQYDVTASKSIKVQSAVNTLKSISINGNALANFDKNTTNYNINTKSSKMTIDAVRTSKKSTLTGTGEKKLVCGNNIYKLTVKAQNGSIKEYTITVNRTCDLNYLKGINVSSGTRSEEHTSELQSR